MKGKLLLYLGSGFVGVAVVVVGILWWTSNGELKNVVKQTAGQQAEETPKTSTSPSTEPTQPAQQPVQTEPEKKNVIPGLTVYALDTAGTSYIVKEKGGKSALIDVGMNADSDKLLSFLETKGLTTLDYVVLSNYHPESIEGASKFWSKAIGNYVILSQNVATNEKGSAVVNFLNSSKTMWVSLQGTARFSLGKTVMEVIPTREGKSALVLLSYGDKNILLSSDITVVGDATLVDLPKSVDLYAVSARADTYVAPKELVDISKQATILVGGKADSQAVKDTVDTFTKAGESGRVIYSGSVCGDFTAVTDGTDIMYACAK